MPPLVPNHHRSFSDYSKSEGSSDPGSAALSGLGYAGMSEQASLCLAFANVTDDSNVVRAPTNTKNLFPFSSLSKVEQFKSQTLPRVMTFIHADQSVLLPSWEPDDSAVCEWGDSGPAIAQHIKSLRIPTAISRKTHDFNNRSPRKSDRKAGIPNMLLNGLGSFRHDANKSDYVEALIESGSHKYVIR